MSPHTSDSKLSSLILTGTVCLYDLSISFTKYFKNSIFEACDGLLTEKRWMILRWVWTCFRLVVWSVTGAKSVQGKNSCSALCPESTCSHSTHMLCTTQRSDVWWWLPDACFVWAWLHSGHDVRLMGMRWTLSMTTVHFFCLHGSI